MGLVEHQQFVIDEGSYAEFKACVLSYVRVPVLGRVYRLLNDDFEYPWRLSTLTSVLVDKASLFPREVLYCTFYRHDVLVECYTYSSRVECLQFSGSAWEERVRRGEIVVDGEDLPDGKIRTWAERKHVRYVVEREIKAQVAVLKAMEIPTHGLIAFDRPIVLHERSPQRSFDTMRWRRRQQKRFSRKQP